jgi:hypothetical protein
MKGEDHEQIVKKRFGKGKKPLLEKTDLTR